MKVRTQDYYHKLKMSVNEYAKYFYLLCVYFLQIILCSKTGDTELMG